MGARISSGFTIIETMLFLAVTGLLVVGALIGAGSALANQRYKDAVETFKNTLQAQYAELGSVKNDRSNAWQCGSDAKPVAGSEYRGQSDCLVVGRYLAISDETISMYTVLANKNAGATLRPTDIATLHDNYTYNVMPGSDDITMEWGTRIAWPSSGSGSKSSTTPRTLGVLIMRSPESGRIYTFTNDVIPSTPAAINSVTFTNMIIAGDGVPGQGAQTVCVQSGGVVFGDDRALYIQAKASGSSSIEVRSNETTARLGGDTKC